MKAPKIGKKRFLRDNPTSEISWRRFINEIYEREADETPLYTGRHFLILKEEQASVMEATKRLEREFGLSVANTADFVKETLNESKIKDADALFYNDLGMALIDMEERELGRLGSSYGEYDIAPEKVVYIPDEIPSEREEESAWGIAMTEAIDSQYSGRGIGVAVLDTGFDSEHPDFAEREVTTRSFVPDETVKDNHGHGTHCIGTACGSVNQQGMRYGVAPASHIHAGKVLSDEGSGAQSWVLDGISWAADSGCRVLSMSFGSRVFAGQRYDTAYERAARYARAKGMLLVAAAGNESRRSKEKIFPVNSPADCPSILAVAALDASLNVADFSNRGINAGGEVDIAAPGVDIYSSWIMPARNRTLSGTSMATPHVAGIIALLFEKWGDATPAKIERELREMARELPLSAEDVGEGLSLAP